MKSLEEIKKSIILRFIKNNSFEKIYNKGIDFFNKKCYKESLECFKLAADKPDIQPQVFYNMALTYQYLEEYEKAKTIYKKFLNLRPNDYDGLYNLALIYYTENSYEKAITLFEKCIDIKRDEDGIKALTLAYIAKGMDAKATELATTLYNNNAPIKLYYTIAKVFESRHYINSECNYLDKALKMYYNILVKNPSDFDVLLSMSICYAKMGEWEHSVEYCKKAIAKNENSYDANNQMGLVYYCCNNIDESIKYYEKALKLKPNGDYKIYSNLAYAYEKNGEKKKAILLFKKLVTKFPQCPAIEEIKNHIRILKASR